MLVTRNFTPGDPPERRQQHSPGRVLKKGGKLVIADFRHAGVYACELEAASANRVREAARVRE
jgi:hypothetical protein